MRLINADKLYEKTAEWEAAALENVKKHQYDDNPAEWHKWSMILAERTAFKFDVADAPTVDYCSRGERKEIIDPVDLVRDLADRIGIHQLYAIAVDLRGEPEQKQGRWEMLNAAKWYRCSECQGLTWLRTPYCPQCGVKME